MNWSRRYRIIGFFRFWLKVIFVKFFFFLSILPSKLVLLLYLQIKHNITNGSKLIGRGRHRNSYLKVSNLCWLLLWIIVEISSENNYTPHSACDGCKHRLTSVLAQNHLIELNLLYLNCLAILFGLRLSDMIYFEDEASAWKVLKRSAHVNDF